LTAGVAHLTSDRWLAPRDVRQAGTCFMGRLARFRSRQDIS